MLYLLRTLCACFLVSGNLAVAEESPAVFVDGVGRTMLPVPRIQRVFAGNPAAAVMLYSLAPERLVGWNYVLSEPEKHFLLPTVRELPVLGGWFGENYKGDRERLLASRPDLVLSIGEVDRTAVEFADRLQEQVGIPVYLGAGALDEIPATYERLGSLLGVPERARLLAAYARQALAQARSFASALPEKERVSVYYAEGLRGLQTDSIGSPHTEALDTIGARNVASSPLPTKALRLSTSLDQVLAWRPEVLLVPPEKQRAWEARLPEWLENPAWQQVPAVATGRVYLIPGTPFNWFDRPPSAARLLGLKWLVWVLYPKRVNFDMVSETRAFYRLFYWYDLGEEEARQMLEASRPKLGFSNGQAGAIH